jgi:hypothetical protein
MADELRRFPILDSVYYNTDEVYSYCDSDVLFMRPFCKLFELSDAGINALFMHDSWDNCYSFQSYHLLTARGIRLPQPVNAGLSCVRRAKYDPEFIEWFLCNPRYARNRHHGVPEQTAWAVLGGRIGCRKWPAVNVAVGRPGLCVTAELIAAHFVGMFRYAFPEYAIIASRVSADVERISPKTISSKRYRSLHLAAGEVQGVLHRSLKKLASEVKVKSLIRFAC